MPDQIRVTPAQLRELADTLENKATRIEQRVENTSQIVESAIVRSFFAGHLATQLITRYRQVHSTMETWPGYLTQFAQRLREAADAFEQADTAQSLFPLPGGMFPLGPDRRLPSPMPLLFGSNPAADYMADYQLAREESTAYYASDLSGDPEYEEARKEIEQGKNESDEHYEWRLQKEAYHKRWKKAYYDDGVFEGTGFDKMMDIAHWLAEWYAWNEAEKQWIMDNPEPQ